MIRIEQFETAEASADFLVELKTLLNDAFGDSFSEEDWDHGLGGRHFAILEEGRLVAYCAVVPRRIFIEEKPYSCGYLENVASVPDKRHQGFASIAVREANQFIATHFEFGGLSTSKHDFYRKLGWQIWLGPTFVISNEEWKSSDSENGGIMILETGAVPALDFQCRIACQERPGDDW